MPGQDEGTSTFYELVSDANVAKNYTLRTVADTTSPPFFFEISIF